MGMTKMVKVMLAEREMTMTDLANKMGKSLLNVSAKLKRDNLSESELKEIAKACDATFVGYFILNDSGKEIK